MKKTGILLLLLLLLTGCSALNVDNTDNNTESNSKVEETKTEEYTMPHGELLDIKDTCAEYNDDYTCKTYVLVLKAKIKKSYSNKATINQNYFNVADYIRKNDVSKFSEVQYWAIADMSDGSESKIISFTVSKNLIDKIIKGEVVDNQLGGYVSELYILESLKQ